jgi:hypothetical protein
MYSPPRRGALPPGPRGHERALACLDDLLRLVDERLLGLVRVCWAGVVQDVGSLLIDETGSKCEVRRVIRDIRRVLSSGAVRSGLRDTSVA